MKRFWLHQTGRSKTTAKSTARTYQPLCTNNLPSSPIPCSMLLTAKTHSRVWSWQIRPQIPMTCFQRRPLVDKTNQIRVKLVRLAMFKRSINYPQIYQSLTPGKPLLFPSWVTMWSRQWNVSGVDRYAPPLGVMCAIRTKHVLLEKKKKKETIRCDAHLDRQYTDFGNHVGQFDICNAKD